MRTRTLEIIVGAVSLTALAILIAVTINLKKSTVFSRKYPLTVLFKDVKRLAEGAPVYVHGVVRGDVRKIEPSGIQTYPVRVTLMLKAGTTLHRGAKFRIVSAGLMGETEIGIEDTSPTAPVLTSEDEIFGIQTMDIHEVLAKAPAVISDIQEAVAGVAAILADEKNREAFSNVLVAASSITGKIDQALGSSSDDITSAIRNIRTASEQFNRLMVRTETMLTTVSKDLTGAGGDLALMVADIRTSAASMVARLEEAARQLSEASQKANQLIALAEDILSENRGDAQRAVQGLTSTTVHLGQILARLDQGDDTLAHVLLGEKSSSDLSQSIAKFNESMDILQNWLRGLDRWLTGAPDERRRVDIPYEGVTTGTISSGTPSTKRK